MLNNPFKYSDPSGHIALPYLMEDRGGPITYYKPTTPPKIVQTVQKKPAAVPPSIQKNIQAEQNYQKAEVIQNNKNVKNTQEAQKIAVITDYLNRTGASTYENGIGPNPSKTTSTSNSTITIGGTTGSTGNSSSYSYTNEKYLKEDTAQQKQLKNDSWNIKNLVNAENSIFSNKNVTSVLSGLANMAFGGLTWSIGATALITIMTGGLALAPMLILGALARTSALYGLSNMFEGAHQVLLGANGKGGEKSYNVLRDTVFQGNSELYHTIGIGSSILTTGGMSGLSQGGTLVNMVKGMGKEVLKDAIGGGSGFLAGNAVYEATGSKILSGIAGVGAGLYAESSFYKLLNPVNNVVTPTTNTASNQTVVLDGGAEAGRLIPGEIGVVTGGNSTTLGKNIMESMDLSRDAKWTGYQAQHIIPAQMADNPVLQKIGMDLDDASNGIFLRAPGTDVSAMSRHQGYHSVYNDVVQKQLDSMNINQSVEVLQKQVFELQTNLRYLQMQGLPLYKGQGATVNMWMSALEKLK